MHPHIIKYMEPAETANEVGGSNAMMPFIAAGYTQRCIYSLTFGQLPFHAYLST